MKIHSLYLILIILLSFSIRVTSSDKKKNIPNSNSYFPATNGVTLVYESTFGECSTKYFVDGKYIISLSEADKFKYRQNLLIKEDGVYAEETYMFLKIFLLFTKESTFTYGTPLLRFPLPLSPGIEWKWEGEEYSGGDTSKVKITGKVRNKEFVKTKAGIFEAIKLESVVEGSSKSKNKVTEWYAEGIGLIKAKIIIEGGGIMGLMRDILGYSIIEFELIEVR